MRIGLDLDGVIVDSIGSWVRVLNREAGTAFRPGDLPDPYATPELARVADRHELEMLIAPPAMAGVAPVLERLGAAGHELVVITARAPRLRRLTEAWLAYQGLAVDRLHFLAGGSKAPAARAERLDLMVEDAPHNALALAAAGVPVLLFAAPYNAGLRRALVEPCAGWPAVLGAVGGGGAERFGT